MFFRYFCFSFTFNRRVKADVLSQLPAKRRELVVLDPSIIKKGSLGRHAKTMLTDKLSVS